MRSLMILMIGFPLRVNWSQTRPRFLHNRTALCRYFPVIFGEETTRAVLGQDVLDMAYGSRGLSFGHGSIWIQPMCTERSIEPVCKGGAVELRFTTANILTKPGP